MRNIGKYIIKAFLALFAALPLKAHYAISGFVAWLAGSALHYRTDDVMINLSRCFPEKNNYELRDLKKEFYHHFAKVIVETVWFGGCRNPQRLKDSHIVEIANPELLARMYEESPSVVVMYTHCGNWELMGGIINYNYSDADIPVSEDNYCVVYRRMSSRVWDEIMRDNRFAPVKDKRNFDGYVESKQMVRYAYAHREEKKIYNVNTDQRPYFPGPEYMKVNFLHQECQTMTGAAALAHKFGFSVLYQRMAEKENGRGYTIEYVPICENGSEMSVEDMMGKYYELLEKDIKEQPYNYLWSHRRWVQI